MNKVALITGGARRIGAETANYLHSKGINIVITQSKNNLYFYYKIMFRAIYKKMSQ